MLRPGERHRRERLVHFVQIDIVDREAGLAQRLVGREQGFFEHDDGIARGDGQVDDAGDRRQAVRFQGAFVDDQHRAGAVADLAGIRGREMTPPSRSGFTEAIASSVASRRMPSSRQCGSSSTMIGTISALNAPAWVAAGGAAMAFQCVAVERLAIEAVLRAIASADRPNWLNSATPKRGGDASR